MEYLYGRVIYNAAYPKAVGSAKATIFFFRFKTCSYFTLVFTNAHDWPNAIGEIHVQDFKRSGESAQ